MAQVPLLPAMREGGDTGVPIVLSQPDAPASLALREAADRGASGHEVEGGQAAHPDDEPVTLPDPVSSAQSATDTPSTSKPASSSAATAASNRRTST